MIDALQGFQNLCCAVRRHTSPYADTDSEPACVSAPLDAGAEQREDY